LTISRIATGFRAAGRRSVLLLLLVVYFAVALTYSVLTPAWETPDELGHAAYITHLRANRSLPEQKVGVMGAAQHPPLYYALAALVTLPAPVDDPTGGWIPNPNFVWDAQGGPNSNIALHRSAETFPYRGMALFLHLARLASVLMGVGTVALIALIGWEIFPARPSIGLASAAFAGFVPQFLFISGSVNNDNLLVLAVTAVWWLSVRALAHPENIRRWLGVGLLLAVALLAKSSAVIACLVVGGLILFVVVQRRSPALLVRAGLAVTLPIVLGVGWWFIRNQILYGDPLGWAVFAEVYAAVFRTTPFTANDLRHFFTTQMNSFWGLFGWMNVWAPSWFYTTIRLFSATSLIGLLAFLGLAFRRLSPFQRSAVGLLAVAALAQEMYMLYAVQRFDASWYQGRYLFSVIAPLFLLASIGIHHLLPRAYGNYLAAICGTGLFALALYMPFRVIAPAYPTIPQPKSALWFLPHKTGYRFNEMIALKGYRLEDAPDGASVDVVLYWQALQPVDFNYSAFVHLLDESGEVVAQKDHAPGEDVGYPPQVWYVGDIVEDRHSLSLPAGQTGPFRVRVGLYNWETGVQATVREAGQELGGFVILDATVPEPGSR
jgi:4-amino-4-deoxy-L-arabinose transferase-like glycosyltransferase